MKFASLIVAALVAAPLTLSAEGYSLGSASCLEGADCGGISEERPASYFLFNGQTIDDLKVLNELIEIKDENTVIPANTLIRIG